ncbi:hypothetical protein CC86DRAFT_411351 [Ophiobolus disseminans]|uniref:RING-type domain-containing protein n=1 Tax=Ophiobolus disseminans TaxID=1469910 RepID=A0A6A6ZK27_9PLEO|nr:hypothetical protein CC86DRAFT_411351 [Ophiobolus disseminans]
MSSALLALLEPPRQYACTLEPSNTSECFICKEPCVPFNSNEDCCYAVRLKYCDHVIGHQCFEEWITRMPETCPYWNHHLPLDAAGNWVKRERLRFESFPFRQIDALMLDCPYFGIRPSIDRLIAAGEPLAAHDLKNLRERYISIVFFWWIVVFNIWICFVNLASSNCTNCLNYCPSSNHMWTAIGHTKRTSSFSFSFRLGCRVMLVELRLYSRNDDCIRDRGALLVWTTVGNTQPDSSTGLRLLSGLGNGGTFMVRAAICDANHTSGFGHGYSKGGGGEKREERCEGEWVARDGGFEEMVGRKICIVCPRIT